MAWRIEQVDRVAGVVELQHGGGNRDAPLLLQLHPVGGHLALLALGLHSAGLLDRTAVKQQLFGEGGFTRIRVGNDREIAAPRHRLRQARQTLIEGWIKAELQGLTTQQTGVNGGLGDAAALGGAWGTAAHGSSLPGNGGAGLSSANQPPPSNDRRAPSPLGGGGWPGATGPGLPPG